MGSTKFNPYEVLGLAKDCSEKDIQKAYKVQCLKWHPDKNRDNQEEAQRKFILAKEAFEFLYDKERRSEYDRGVEAVRVRDEKQRERMEKADEKRRKFMEDLKEREGRFTQEQQKADELTPAQLAAKRKMEEKRVKCDFEDLARRLFQEVEQEMKAKNEQLHKQLAEHRSKSSTSETNSGKLRVRWKPYGGISSEADIRRKFSSFGTISEVSPILDTKKGQMCIIEFSSVSETGYDLQLPPSDDMEKFKLDWQETPRPPSKSPKEDDDVIVIEDEPAERPSHNFEAMSFDDLLANFDSRLNDAPSEKKTRQS